MTNPEDQFDKRTYDKEIWTFIGNVNEHMKNDAIFKENYLKVETRVGKVENRVTKVETKQAVVQWVGGTLTLAGLGFIARLLIKSH